MDTLTPHIEFKDHVYVAYSIETLNGRNYFVYYLENTGTLGFIRHKRSMPERIYRGSLNYKDKSYLFYEISNKEIEFLPTNLKDLWKVTPYEILYPRKVNEFDIQDECVNLFKAHPFLCKIKEDEEVPVVAYLGIGVSEIKEQILIQNRNEKKGLFGKGYYFNSYDISLYNAYYKEESDPHLIRLENKKNLSDHEIQDNSVHIQGNSFYHYSYYLGEIPNCYTNIPYVIYYYDQESIYLKSAKPNGCKTEVTLRKEDGYVMRYILFLKNHSNQKIKTADSYAYDSMYMVKNTDDFICLSYHLIKKK
jgi:hypothetical protein